MSSQPGKTETNRVTYNEYFDIFVICIYELNHIQKKLFLLILFGCTENLQNLSYCRINSDFQDQKS